MIDDNDAVDDFGRTCLHRMCQQRDPAPIATIIALCDEGLRIDRRDVYRITPFEYLSEDALQEIARRRPDLVMDYWTSKAPPVRIVSNPQRMGGQPCVEGTRIPADTVLAQLKGGYSTAEIYGHIYPSLPDGAIEACIEWDRNGRHTIAVNT